MQDLFVRVVENFGSQLYNEENSFPISYVVDFQLEAKEVVNKERLEFSLSAPVGHLHGATSTTQFVVIFGDKQIRRLKILDCYPTHCTLQYDRAEFNIPSDAVVYMSPSDLTIINVHLAGDWLQRERHILESASNHPDYSFRLVDSENSHVSFHGCPVQTR